MFLVKAFSGLNGRSAFFLFCPVTGLERSVEFFLHLCKAETHFSNYIIINSESRFSKFPPILLFSTSRLSPLRTEFHSRAFAEERGRAVHYGRNCYYSPVKGKVAEGALWRAFKIIGERHGGKPIEASFTKFIHKKKSVCF